MKFNSIDTRFILSGLISWPVLLYFFWGFAVKRYALANGEYSFRWWWVNIIGFPFLLLFAVIDVAYNWTVGTFLFAEWPREFMFTARIDRWHDYRINDDPYRNAKVEMADYICELLARADPDHC